MSELASFFLASTRVRWADPHGAGPVAYLGNACWVLLLGVLLAVVLRRRLRPPARAGIVCASCAVAAGLVGAGTVRLWVGLGETVAGIAELELTHGGLLLALGPGVPVAVPERRVGLVRVAAMTHDEALSWLARGPRLIAARTRTLAELGLEGTVGVVWSGAGISVVSAEAPWYWRRPMLTWVSSHDAELLWETPDAEVGAVRVRAGRKRWVVNEAVARKVHRVQLTDLAPSTVHAYRLRSRSVPGEDGGAFRTLPAPGDESPLRFGVLGDSGNGGSVTRRLIARLAEFQPDVVLHVGDLAYERATRASLYAQFYGPIAELASQVPIWVVPGNHDLLDGGLDLARFFGLAAEPGAPSPFERSLHAAGVVVTSLNSNAPPLPFTAARAAVSESFTAAAPPPWWRLAFFHHPPFPGEGRGRNELVYWLVQPLLLGSRVDIAFAGHSHNFQRSLPLGLIGTEPRGVRYVVSGGGGGELRDPDSAAETVVGITAHHVVRAVALRGRLWLEAVDEHGVVLDHVVLAKDDPTGLVREEPWSEPPGDTRPPLPALGAAESESELDRAD
ncbi:MAG: metallophosphoesterase [bacterium]